MADMDILIRRYESGDFDPVTRLWRRSREISLPDFQREKGYPFEMDQAYFKNQILAKNDVWIAEIQSELVGFMAIHEDLIDHLYIDPDHWRHGIGKMLLDHARTLSPKHLWLYTLQINTHARAFYVKNGFVAKKFGISPLPESEPDVEYHWNPV